MAFGVGSSRAVADQPHTDSHGDSGRLVRMPASWGFGVLDILRLDEDASEKPFLAFLEQMCREHGVPLLTERYHRDAFIDGADEYCEVVVDKGVARVTPGQPALADASAPTTGDIGRQTLDALLGSPNLVAPDVPRAGAIGIPDALQNEDVGPTLSFVSTAEAQARLSTIEARPAPGFMKGKQANKEHAHLVEHAEYLRGCIEYADSHKVVVSFSYL